MKSDDFKSVDEVLEDVEKNFTNDLGTVTINKLNNFFFRLFSKHVRKWGGAIVVKFSFFRKK